MHFYCEKQHITCNQKPARGEGLNRPPGGLKM